MTKDKFSFTPENKNTVTEILAKYPPDRKFSAILPLLDLAQRQNGGWLSRPAIEFVAELIGMPVIRAYEVATFYTMFNLAPVGKHHVQICRTTPCWLQGSDDVKRACEDHLKIKCGEVTDDGLFSLVEVECIGACVSAPVVQINDTYYEKLTPDDMRALLDDLATEQPVEHKVLKPEKSAKKGTRKKKEDDDAER